MSKRLTLRTRKPIDQLTAADLVVFPIWEFARSLSAAADFRTASGVIIPGFVGVTTAGGVELGHGVLLPDAKYVFIDVSDVSAKGRTARALGLAKSKVFPLSFTLRVRIGREKAFREGSFG